MEPWERTLALWAGWVEDCMNDLAFHGDKLTQLWDHFVLSRDDDDPRLALAGTYALHTLIWHPGFPLSRCYRAIIVCPDVLHLTPHWQMNTMADPNLENARRVHLEQRARRAAKTAVFGLLYGTRPSDIPQLVARVQTEIQDAHAALTGLFK